MRRHRFSISRSRNVALTGISILLGLLVCFSAGGQSIFAMRNYNPLADAPVYDALGIPLAGNKYLVELWGGVTVNSLTPLPAYTSGTRNIVPFLDDGYFLGGIDLLDTPVPGGWGWLQVRAWEARLGDTYDEAVAKGMGGFGESNVFYAKGGDPTLLPPTPPGELIGLQSFSLRAIPEPSGASLLLLGGGLAWLRARRKPKGVHP